MKEAVFPFHWLVNMVLAFQMKKYSVILYPDERLMFYTREIKCLLWVPLTVLLPEAFKMVIRQKPALTHTLVLVLATFLSMRSNCTGFLLKQHVGWVDQGRGVHHSAGFP